MFTGLATCKTILDDWTQGESFEDLQAQLWDFIETYQMSESLRSCVWPVKTALIHCPSLLLFCPYGVVRWSFIARIEGPLFHRWAPASTKDYMTASPSSLHLNLLPQYNEILQA